MSISLSSRTWITALLLILAGALPCPARLLEHRMVHQVGTQLLDAQGKPITFRGVNLGGWLIWEGWIFGEAGPAITSDPETKFFDGLVTLTSPREAKRFRSAIYRRFIRKEDIRSISEAGFNMVRVPLHHHLFTSGNIGWSKLDELLGWCSEYGIYVVLDLHSAPGGQSTCWCADPEGVEPTLPPKPGPLWASAKNQQETIALWQKLANHCKNSDTIAGYDLLNEPAPPNGPALVSFYQKLIQAVRLVDPNHLIILEGGNSSTDFSMFGHAPCQNMAYSCHVYWWSGDGEKKFREYESLAVAQQRPFWAGEFGEPLDYAWIRKRSQTFVTEKTFCGWCFWTWKKVKNSAPGLVTVNPSPRWKDSMKWMKYRWWPKPQANMAAVAMREFVESVSITPKADPKMLQALH